MQTHKQKYVLYILNIQSIQDGTLRTFLFGSRIHVRSDLRADGAEYNFGITNSVTIYCSIGMPYMGCMFVYVHMYIL